MAIVPELYLRRLFGMPNKRGFDLPLKVLIFDFDGVIVESNDIKTRAFERVFSRFPEHCDAMMAFHYENISVSRYVKFERLISALVRDGDPELTKDLAADFSCRVLAEMMTVPLVNGAEALLTMVAGRLPIYLASVTPEPELKHILTERGLAGWFNGVYGCPPWTKPNAIRDVLTKEPVSPEEVLLIGDSVGDQRAASETGVRFLGRHSGLEFDSPPPTAFADLNEIAIYLKDSIA